MQTAHRAMRTRLELTPITSATPRAPGLETLESVQRRVLWLAARMVHEANHVRPNPDGTKVGGHQASTASVVSILTALYFGWLRHGDRVAIKPHASPGYHAVQYLLGNLERRYLSMLRQFGGLQAYPSRTKDPDPVDFSTGSVGLGVAATLFAALADRYAAAHFGTAGRPPRRFVAVAGDAELDEGNIWEAVSDFAIQEAKLGQVLWIVDLNRQSLDRVVPGIRARQLEAMFGASGWQVLETKYGRRLQACFAGPGGVALRRCIDDMPNEQYQSLVRLPGAEARTRLLEAATPNVRDALARSVAHVPDAELTGVLGDLGGHDLGELLQAFRAADAARDQPTVLFAYTMKGWGLPIAGDPLNHSALLTAEQIEGLRAALGADPQDEWAGFAPESPEGRLCQEAAQRLYPGGWRKDDALPPAIPPEQVPPTLGTRVAARTSSQEAFGNALVEISRTGGPVAERLVTTSPDVSISTSLGGWINRAGVFAVEEQTTAPEASRQLLRWQPGPHGQHLELGISEMNLFLLLGMLGLGHELLGELLLPVGTVYDPFVCRGLDALIYGTYSASKFVCAGTPSGVTLSPEGGAHQSSITSSIGLELPNLQLYEPCFQRETEWCLLDGLRQCLDRQDGLSTYLRLSTRPIEQSLLQPALERLGEAMLRAHVLAGGYRLLEPPSNLVASGAPRVVLACSGALVPETVLAAQELHAEGVAATVLNLTSADRLYRVWQSHLLHGVRTGTTVEAAGHLAALIMAEERRAPLVAVQDAASHNLAWLGGVFGQPLVPLGVDCFGQSGTRADLYAFMGIDSAHIVSAALQLLARTRE